MTDAAPLPPLEPDAIAGCLLGQAVGDMMGLPAENLSPRRVAKLFPRLDRPRFFFGYGAGSDDTEHAFMTGQALLRSGGDVDRFRRSLAWRLRWWFAAGPPGIGLATLKSCLKLWLGFPSTRSGVYSAGNGPAMRASILGVTDAEGLGACAWAAASTELTHTDPQARIGSLVIAFTARWVATARDRSPDPEAYFRQLFKGDPLPSHLDLIRYLLTARDQLAAGRSVAELVAAMGLRRGVSGYIAHSVPVAVFAFFRHPDDYRAAVEAVIRCGGDTDTVAAVTGALVGARVGKGGIPPEWLSRFADWPLSTNCLEELARRLAAGHWRTAPQPAVPVAWWAYPARNLLFFLVVLGHLTRRLLPPY